MNIFVMDNRNVVAVVKDLIQAVRDEQEGFRLAAEAFERRDVKVLLVYYSHQRASFFQELHRLEQVYCEDFEELDNSSRELNAGWNDLHTALDAHDLEGILAACECGETHTIGCYRVALSKELPLDVQMLIGAQSLEVKAAHDKVRYLRGHALAA